MSNVVQDELASIFQFGQSTSLDAERKIAQDKKNEKARLSTLARASRNSILTRFRTTREEVVKASIGRRRAAKQIHMNVRALALQQKPSLSCSTKRGSGRCSSRTKVDAKAMSAYIAEKLETLTEQTKRIRESVRQQRRSVVGEVPISNQDWLRWLEENERCFQEHLNSAYKLRRGLNVRVEPDGVMPHGPSLLVGQDDSLISSWHSLLQCSPPGFYCVDWGSQKCVLFHVSCRGTSLFVASAWSGT
jgi:hypothetical protein